MSTGEIVLLISVIVFVILGILFAIFYRAFVGNQAAGSNAGQSRQRKPTGPARSIEELEARQREQRGG